jgi:glycine cleavage system H lipoate-binding protein
VYTVASHGWLTTHKADHLTVGIRDAYHAGLGIALPTGPHELGWAMDAELR